MKRIFLKIRDLFQLHVGHIKMNFVGKSCENAAIHNFIYILQVTLKIELEEELCKQGDIKVTWYFKGQPLVEGQEQFSMGSDEKGLQHVLDIDALTEAHAGQYTCTATSCCSTETSNQTRSQSHHFTLYLDR